MLDKQILVELYIHPQESLPEVMVVQVDFILYKFKLQGMPDETH
jgi:hypothetical protein